MNDSVLQELYRVILSRKESDTEGSYTCYLFREGLDKILKKVGEESAETIIAAKNTDNDALTGEICDLFYHVLVLCAQKNLPLDAILEELSRRAQKIGNLKTKHTSDHES